MTRRRLFQLIAACGIWRGPVAPAMPAVGTDNMTTGLALWPVGEHDEDILYLVVEGPRLDSHQMGAYSSGLIRIERRKSLSLKVSRNLSASETAGGVVVQLVS